MSAQVFQALLHSGMREAEAQRKVRLFAATAQQLQRYSDAKPLRWLVPGRIEVLGKHTDYAAGRSLLCTAERGFCICAAPRSDAVLRISDVVRRATFECVISPELAIPESGWTVYPAVVARRLAQNFPGGMRGADISIASDLPPAAGMSSSSALVVAMFAVLSEINRLPERPEYTSNIPTVFDLASYLGCIENGQSYGSLQGAGGVGTFGGSEDHTAILTSEPGHLKQYSFCPVRHERTVQVPGDCIFVIAVSGIVASKTGSAKARYNRTSSMVQEILHCWRTTTGLKPAALAEAANSSPDAPDQIRAAIRQTTSSGSDQDLLIKRFDQFLIESEHIIPAASDALSRNDLKTLGTLADESQKAAEDLLGNQVPETIWLAKSARELGAHAASAFGAGFGGSVWALVARDAVPQFIRNWQSEYESIFSPAAESSHFFLTTAGPALCML